jgi:hypothetical protein
MMIKGGIRIGGLGISGYDADAVAYFERAGVTDATAKGQINAFVKGVKDLGLYNSMVCWPLRSTQNPGTGLIAYSLGGLGIYNATLVNSPARGVDGITTTISGSSKITTETPNNLFFANGTLAYVAKFATTYNGPYYHYWFPFPFQFLGFTGSASLKPTIQGGGNQIIDGIDSPAPPSGVDFEFKAFSINGSNVIANRNGSTTFSEAQTQTPTYVSTGHELANSDATASMGWLFSSALSNAQMVSLYTLYKTTLGTGLGLP